MDRCGSGKRLRFWPVFSSNRPWLVSSSAFPIRCSSQCVLSITFTDSMSRGGNQRTAGFFELARHCSRVEPLVTPGRWFSSPGGEARHTRDAHFKLDPVSLHSASVLVLV